MNKFINKLPFYSFIILMIGAFAVLTGLLFGGDFLAGMAGGSDTNSYIVGLMLYGGLLLAIAGLVLLIISTMLKKFTSK